MSFLSRFFVVIGLSVLMTLVLMVIHWEPERSAAPAVETPASPAPIAARPEPTIQQAAAVRTTPTEPLHDSDGGDWVMQDARDIEGLPAELRGALAGCLIPRSSEFPNVLSGEFKQAGESRGPQRGSRAGVEADLAVLCVRGARAAVYVFWGGHPASLEIATEFDFIPGTFIRTALAADIGVQVRGELPIEPGMPLRIRHDGIQLGKGCCATTYYRHRGRWRAYVSAD